MCSLQVRRSSSHYSGGNSTRTGVFSILYGIYPTYWDHFLKQNRSPVLIDHMQELDYEFGVFSSTALTFPEFRRTAFINIQDSIKDQYQAGSQAAKDKLVIKDLSDFLKKQSKTDRPFFTYTLLDGAHSSYSFPHDQAKFHPFNKRVNYSLLTDEQKRVHMKNRYHNALYYLDHQIKNLLEQIKELDNTIVIITGDHGDEFMEYGHIGHANAFTKPQIKSPLIFSSPKTKANTIHRLTSHYDIVPTLMKKLGVLNKTSDYSHGTNLLEPKNKDYTLSCSWDKCAAIHEDGLLIFGTKNYNSIYTEYKNNQYQAVSSSHKIALKSQAFLPSLLKKMGEFLR